VFSDGIVRHDVDCVIGPIFCVPFYALYSWCLLCILFCVPACPLCRCRVGGRDKFFHCDTCGCCYAVELRNNHRCIQGSMHQNCPVCQENLFNSTSECRVLRCGHTMHRDCLRALVPLLTCCLCFLALGCCAWLAEQRITITGVQGTLSTVSAVRRVNH